MAMVLKKSIETSVKALISIEVNQLGLEPRTPSLKGMCSTC